MKYKIKFILFLFTIVLITPGCESYLDKSIDDGASEQIIYKNFTTMLGFMDRVYGDSILVNIHAINRYRNARSHPGSISDELAQVANDAPEHFVTAGNWLETSRDRYEVGSKGVTSISRAYSGLRIVNRVINDIDKVQVLSPLERSYLLGQAYFLRAHFYFELIKRYGGMPIFDKLLSPSDNLDIPRETYLVSSDWMITDLDNAIKYLPSQWPDEHIGRPNKLSALALKSMAMLYAASPLMQNGLDKIENKGYNTERARLAAIAAQATIDSINIHPYHKLMATEEYRSIFLMPGANHFAQPEYLWYLRSAAINQSASMRSFWITQPYENKTGSEGTPYSAPTQNMVDLFEKKGNDGFYYPITDPNSGYNPQDPYKDRDPRFSNNILYPGEAWGTDLSGKQVYVPTYQGGYSPDFISTNLFTNARQQTGYMFKKFWWPEANNTWQNDFAKYRIITVFIRVAQVYLDFAEASFEATGSATAVIPGCSMSALSALNVIRNRAGIGDLPASIANDPAKFRQAYRRERAVELMCENHRWWDIRRWMIFDEVFVGQYPIKGIKATPKNHPYTPIQLKSSAGIYYKLTDFDYEVVDVVSEVRNYSLRNYWYPLPMDDVAALHNLKQNPGW